MSDESEDDPQSESERKPTSPSMGMQNTPNVERYVLAADAMRRRQLRSALLHGSGGTWREYPRMWIKVSIAAIAVAVVMAGLTVTDAFHVTKQNQQEQEQKQREQEQKRKEEQKRQEKEQEKQRKQQEKEQEKREQREEQGEQDQGDQEQGEQQDEQSRHRLPGSPKQDNRAAACCRIPRGPDLLRASSVWRIGAGSIDAEAIVYRSESWR